MISKFPGAQGHRANWSAKKKFLPQAWCEGLSSMWTWYLRPQWVFCLSFLSANFPRICKALWDALLRFPALFTQNPHSILKTVLRTSMDKNLTNSALVKWLFPCQWNEAWTRPDHISWTVDRPLKIFLLMMEFVGWFFLVELALVSNARWVKEKWVTYCFINLLYIAKT